MKETQLDFDKDFESDEEAMAFVDEVVTEIANSEASTSVTIPERVKRVEVAYKALRLIAKGKDVDVTYELNAPYTSMGSVSIVGKEVIITNPALFAKVAEMASNFEVYPKTNGTVEMNFTFHNLTRKVGN